MMVLALDLGSTAFKAAVFDDRLRRLGDGSAAVEYHYAAGGVIEMDAAMVAAAVRAAADDALAAAGCAASGLAGLAVTSQAQTFLIADSAGRARTRFISWQDTRAAAGRDALLGHPAFAAGFPAHCSFPALLKELQVCQLRLLRDGGAGPAADAERVVCLPEYVGWLASGKHVLDNNLAAMSGLYSRRQESWWDLALNLCGLRKEQLAEVVPVGCVGAVTSRAAQEQFGLPPGLPLVLAGNDQTAGAYGAQVRERAAILLTLGTAHVAYTCEPAAAGAGDAARWVVGPFPGGGTYRLAVEAAGGSVVNWARGILAGAGDDEHFFRLAAQAPPGANGLRFTPDLPDGAGGWDGLGLHHGPADLARSVLEALSARIVGLVQALGTDPRRTPVLAAGGGSRQPLWVAMVADALGRTVEPVQADPLAGAARMAHEALARRGG